MMEFLFVPAIVGMITYGIYSIFELFTRRKERMMFIEKLGSGTLSGDLRFGKIEYSNKFSTIKWSGLLLGLGAGLLIGFVIGDIYMPYDDYLRLVDSNNNWQMLQKRQELLGIVYGSCVLLGGGLGLLAAFLVEYRLSGKDKK